MGHKPEWANQNHKKTGGSTASFGVKSRELFHGASKPGIPVQRFADGSEGGVQMPGPDYQDTNAGMAEASPVSAPAKIEEKPLDSKPQKFGDAFKTARASGAKEFEWQGKKYTTQLKEEVKPAAKPAAKADPEPAKPTKTFSEDVAERKKAMEPGRRLSGTELLESADPAKQKSNPTEAKAKPKFSRFYTPPKKS